MKNKNIIIILFLIVAVAQLFVPLQMIYNQEDIINTGKIVKFQCEPIDPNDPFRGKYITLNFKESEIKVKKIKTGITTKPSMQKLKLLKTDFQKSNQFQEPNLQTI